MEIVDTEGVAANQLSLLILEGQLHSLRRSEDLAQRGIVLACSENDHLMDPIPA